jgi:hypothetical protein
MFTDYEKWQAAERELSVGWFSAQRGKRSANGGRLYLDEYNGFGHR